MNVSKGLIVMATAGRDCGGLFVITGNENQYCLIADGKSRKLSSPKRKNPKHLKFTEKCVDLNNMTDKKLKKILSEYSDELT
ncbi:MAG: KOW domain-containing RNA-binding protein [Oscillospiraceae bacterium]|nr:KOW domain-containing RNA-binding protein [Oscillospiraceae bacterium]